MSVYDYEKFLDKYDSDKAIKKFITINHGVKLSNYQKK